MTEEIDVETLRTDPALPTAGKPFGIIGTGYAQKWTQLLVDGVGASRTFKPDHHGYFDIGSPYIVPSVKSVTIIAKQLVSGKTYSEVKRITVSVMPAPTTTPVPDPVPTPVPTIPSLPPLPAGLTTVLLETFDKDCTEGAFASTYPQLVPYLPSWTDTSGRGHYNPNLASVKGGILNIRLRTENGVPQVFSMTGHGTGSSALGGYLGFRMETVMRADRIPGYKQAVMGWTDTRSKDVLYQGVDLGSDYPKWLDGEIDGPECDFDGSTMKGFVHYRDVDIDVDLATKKIKPLEAYQESVDLGVNPDNWHVPGFDWRAGQYVAYLLDGVEKGPRITNRVPIMRFHPNWQFETNLHGWAIDPATAGNIQIAALRIAVPS